MSQKRRLRRKQGPELSGIVDGRIEFVCPFCKQKAYAGYTKEGVELTSFDETVKKKTEKGEPVVMHTLPPCQKYLELDLVEYMKLVNIYRGANN